MAWSDLASVTALCRSPVPSPEPKAVIIVIVWAASDGAKQQEAGPAPITKVRTVSFRHNSRHLTPPRGVTAGVFPLIWKQTPIYQDGVQSPNWRRRGAKKKKETSYFLPLQMGVDARHTPMGRWRRGVACGLYVCGRHTISFWGTEHKKNKK